MTYASIFRSNGMFAQAQLAEGAVRLPDPSVEQPAGAYGFSPALLPLWSNPHGPSYCGYWQHWFIEGRQRATVVECFVEDRYRVVEVAMDLSQLVKRILLRNLALGDEPSSLNDFASSYEVDISGLVDVAREYGDSPQALRLVFGDELPRELNEDSTSYHGSFPSSRSPVAELRDCCSLELDVSSVEVFARSPDAPEWFREGSQALRFDQLLSAGDMSAAWLCLNSRGWRFSEMRAALRALDRAVGDVNFSALVEAWDSFDHESAGVLD